MNGLTEWLDSGKTIDPAELKKITEIEEKGDELKRQILIELAKANSLIQREDLLRLVHYNDKLIGTFAFLSEFIAWLKRRQII